MPLKSPPFIERLKWQQAQQMYQLYGLQEDEVAYHTSCYYKANGKEVSGIPAKYPGQCCYCSAGIKTGESISWSRKPQKAEPVPSDSKVAKLSDFTPPGNFMSEYEKLKAELHYLNDAQKVKIYTEYSTPKPNESKDVNILNMVEPKHEDGDILNLSAIAKRVAPMVSGPLEAKVNKAVQEAQEAVRKLGEANRVVVELKAPGESPRDIQLGIQHKHFPTLLKAIQAKVNVWLAGPSGSGKTTAVLNAARALGLKFHYTGSVGDQYALLGYNDANGRYVRTPFREAWETGGVFLWDEVDGSDPNALLAFNGALANKHAPFPDGTIERHPDCILVAAANTWGHGATADYVGRTKMDAAFLKRFVFLDWPYDEAMETATTSNQAWCKRVQRVRAQAASKGIRVLITPRETYMGEALLAQGLTENEVAEMTIYAGMTQDQRKSLE